MSIKKNEKPDVSVIGIGKLGACTAAVYAGHGFNVIGFDVDAQKVAALNAGAAPVFEPQLADVINRLVSNRRLRSRFGNSGDCRLGGG